jgi:hypothetical protein
MSRTRRSWTEKLQSDRPFEITVVDQPMLGWPAGTTMLIATPLIIDGYLRAIPSGMAVAPAKMRDDLAKEYGTQMTCALTAGIFLRIASEAALEAMAAGAVVTSVAPFWRVVERKSPLAKKLSCGPEEIARLRAAEGITP